MVRKTYKVKHYSGSGCLLFESKKGGRKVHFLPNSNKYIILNVKSVWIYINPLEKKPILHGQKRIVYSFGECNLLKWNCMYSGEQAKPPFFQFMM